MTFRPKDHGEDHDIERPDCDGGRSRLVRLKIARLRWNEAVNWAHEQERRREAEQARFARERVRLELEAAWAMPAWSLPESADA
ncbi:MAG TPA: hypothetical protein VHW26_13935 [Solirubrobacteraceae bacterium]|jgi:hypothetical protein|nr:hypothetical protein [Solirubrobacteraceae bacterium]